MTPNCNNCKYSTTIGLDCVCIGVKEPYKVSPTHYCEDWKASLETIADHIRQYVKCQTKNQPPCQKQ